MKKLLLTAAVAVFGIIATQAQEIQFGAKASLNIAGLISGDDNTDENGRVGATIGGLAEYRFNNDWFALQGELLYSMQGTKENENGNVQSDFDLFDIKLNYINVPIMAKFYVYKGINLYAGPQVGFLVSSEIEGLEAGLEPDFETIDFSAIFGGGYQFDGGFFLDLRYNIGLTEVVSDSDYKNIVFQLGAGYKF